MSLANALLPFTDKLKYACSMILDSLKVTVQVYIPLCDSNSGEKYRRLLELLTVKALISIATPVDPLDQWKVAPGMIVPR